MLCMYSLGYVQTVDGDVEMCLVGFNYGFWRWVLVIVSSELLFYI
jgi:hypothetical protein